MDVALLTDEFIISTCYRDGGYLQNEQVADSLIRPAHDAGAMIGFQLVRSMVGIGVASAT